MNEANTRYLFDNFRFFRPERPATEALMCFGFECGDGWFKIIRDLCEKLQELGLPDDFEVVQVKEKWSTLSFYVENVPEEKQEAVRALISEASKRSAETCENCGKPGSHKKRGSYHLTYCTECFIDLGK